MSQGKYQQLLTMVAGLDEMNNFGKSSRNTVDDEVGQQAFSKPAPIPKGCKEFNINGHKIVASNYKNACRKAAKLR